jgi:hypothetical protein
MATLGYVVPEGQQSKESFHALRRTTEGLLYYTKIDKDNTDTIDLSNGSPSDTIQNPTSGSLVDFDETLIDVQYLSGDGSDTTFDMTTPVIDADRIRVYVNNILMKENVDFTYSSPTITFIVAPANGAQIAVGKINKKNKNNTSDKYWQYLFEDGDATYYVDSDGYLIKRENRSYNTTALVSDDFTTAESTTYSVASTTYQDAV